MMPVTPVTNGLLTTVTLVALVSGVVGARRCVLQMMVRKRLRGSAGSPTDSHESSVASRTPVWFSGSDPLRADPPNLSREMSMAAEVFWLPILRIRPVAAIAIFICMLSILAFVVDGVALAIVVVFGFVAVALGIRSRTRQLALRNYDRQLLNVLDVLVLSLRSGSSLPGAVKEAGETAKGQVGIDLRDVSKQLELGVRFEESLRSWAERRRTRSVRLIVACIALAHETGASGVHSLSAARSTIRQALVAESAAQTFAAQSRASAFVLSLLPIVLAGPTIAFNATARTFMFHTTVGFAVLVLGLTLNGIGIWWMSLLVKQVQL